MNEEDTTPTDDRKPTRVGKTTNYYTSEQLARLREGCVFFVDPKEDDSEQFLDKIPQDRLDEIVWDDEVQEE